MINSILPVRPESELLTICARTESTTDRRNGWACL